MSTPVMVWSIVIGLFVAAVALRFAMEVVRYCHEDHTKGLPLFQRGTEREEFFVPGDPTYDDFDVLNDED